MTRKVLIAAPVHPILTEGLERLGYHCVVEEAITQAAAYELVKGCSGIITSTRLQLDKGLLAAATDLEWIGRMGSGMEVIDLEAAAEMGISCFASPEGNCNAVGEHALGMLLSLQHRITWSHAEMKQGIWLREENRGMELEGKTVGIIGFGHTGRAFAKKLSGFDVRILAYDKYAQVETTGGIIACDSLRLIFEEADIISFHVPQQNDTVNYFDKRFVDLMKKPFILLNTSRGRVVDLVALLDGMDSGKITGACLDVYESEPVSKLPDELRKRLESRLGMANMIVTPHIGGYTFEALYKMSKVLLSKIPNRV